MFFIFLFLMKNINFEINEVRKMEINMRTLINESNDLCMAGFALNLGVI